MSDVKYKEGHISRIKTSLKLNTGVLSIYKKVPFQVNTFNLDLRYFSINSNKLLDSEFLTRNLLKLSKL